MGGASDTSLSDSPLLLGREGRDPPKDTNPAGAGAGGRAGMPLGVKASLTLASAAFSSRSMRGAASLKMLSTAFCWVPKASWSCAMACLGRDSCPNVPIIGLLDKFG